MAFLSFLEGLRLPVLDRLMQLVTYCGEELVFMIVAILVYWCVSKTEGCYILFVGFLGTLANQFLKLLCRIPRPWVRDPGLHPVDSALPGATGYSFPSGHTQSVTGVFGCLARWNRRRSLRIGCAVLIALTAFSRMYLGVHTPADVGVSLALGLALVFGLYPMLRRAQERPRLLYALLGGMTLLAVAFVLYANLAAFPADIDPENLAHGRKNSYTMLGCLLGFLIGHSLEQRFIRFDTRAPWWGQFIKSVGGLGGLLLLKEGLKALFTWLGYTHLSANALRYGLMVLFATAVWPLLFRLWSRPERTQTP